MKQFWNFLFQMITDEETLQPTIIHKRMGRPYTVFWPENMSHGNSKLTSGVNKNNGNSLLRAKTFISFFK